MPYSAWSPSVTLLNLRIHRLFTVFWCHTPSTRVAIVPNHDWEQGIVGVGGPRKETKPTTVVSGQNQARRSAGGDMHREHRSRTVLCHRATRPAMAMSIL
jgi:hypothetical protein